jgi:four helix bundle protein
MRQIRKFQDIRAWQKSRELVREVYRITKRPDFSRDFQLRDQIRKAVISIPSNIAEGYNRGGRKEFIQFLSIANGSTGEVQTQLYLAYDQGYITTTDFETLLEIADEIGKMIGGFIKYLRKSENKGFKYENTNILNN